MTRVVVDDLRIDAAGADTVPPPSPPQPDSSAADSPARSDQRGIACFDRVYRASHGVLCQVSGRTKGTASLIVLATGHTLLATAIVTMNGTQRLTSPGFSRTAGNQTNSPNAVTIAASNWAASFAKKPLRIARPAAMWAPPVNATHAA